MNETFQFYCMTRDLRDRSDDVTLVVKFPKALVCSFIVIRNGNTLEVAKFQTTKLPLVTL